MSKQYSNILDDGREQKATYKMHIHYFQPKVTTRGLKTFITQSIEKS